MAGKTVQMTGLQSGALSVESLAAMMEGKRGAMWEARKGVKKEGRLAVSTVGR